MASALLCALAGGLEAQSNAPDAAAVTPARASAASTARAPRRTLPKPFARKAAEPRLAPKPTTRPTLAAGSLRDSIVALARAQLGTRYVLGGTNPDRGFDCSGLIRYLAQALKLEVPRTADEQARVGAAVAVDVTRLRPGDLLTFGTGKRISHIGIYVGNGRYVHASTGAGRVIESPVVRRGRGIQPWQGVRRLFADADSAAAEADEDGEG